MRKFRSSVNLVSGRWLTDPVTRSCLVRAGLTNRSAAVDWSCKNTNVKQMGHPPVEALRSLWICATSDELPNELGQPVAWTEPVVLMLIDVRQAHFYCPAHTDSSKVGRLLRSMYGCRDAGVNWEFICDVMIAIGFVQGRTSPCIHRGYTETTLFLLVHRRCQMVLCETAGVCHDSRNPWTSWIPRLCAKHSSAGQDHLGGRSWTCRAHQEIVRRDWPISYNTWSQRQTH